MAIFRRRMSFVPKGDTAVEQALKDREREERLNTDGLIGMIKSTVRQGMPPSNVEVIRNLGRTPEERARADQDFLIRESDRIREDAVKPKPWKL